MDSKYMMPEEALHTSLVYTSLPLDPAERFRCPPWSHVILSCSMPLSKQRVYVTCVLWVMLMYWIYQKAIETIGIISDQVHQLNLCHPPSIRVCADNNAMRFETSSLCESECLKQNRELSAAWSLSFTTSQLQSELSAKIFGVLISFSLFVWNNFEIEICLKWPPKPSYQWRSGS